MSKVLILMGGARKGGNIDLLCDEFMRGAQESGNEVEKLYVAKMNIKGCLGCCACKNPGLPNGPSSGFCVQKDDMQEIIKKCMEAEADAIVYASPALRIFV